MMPRLRDVKDLRVKWLMRMVNALNPKLRTRFLDWLDNSTNEQLQAVSMFNLKWWQDHHYPMLPQRNAPNPWDACFSMTIHYPGQVVGYMEGEFQKGWKAFAFTDEQREILAQHVKSIGVKDEKQLTLHLNLVVQTWIALTYLF
jgi:hypothetical protein